jgi:hypothetical protein
MSFGVKLGAVLAVFSFDAAAAQEGYFGHDHDKWHHGLRSNAPIPRARVAILPIVAPPQEDRSMATTK